MPSCIPLGLPLAPPPTPSILSSFLPLLSPLLFVHNNRPSFPSCLFARMFPKVPISRPLQPTFDVVLDLRSPLMNDFQKVPDCCPSSGATHSDASCHMTFCCISSSRPSSVSCPYRLQPLPCINVLGYGWNRLVGSAVAEPIGSGPIKGPLLPLMALPPPRTLLLFHPDWFDCI